MRIAFLHKDFPFGGAEKVTIDAAHLLINQGHEVVVLTQHHHEEKYPEGAPRHFHVATMPEGRLKSSKVVEEWLAAYVGEHQVDWLVTCRGLLYAQRLRERTGVKILFLLQSTPRYEFADQQGVLRSLSNWFYRFKYKQIYESADRFGVLCDAYREELRAYLHLPTSESKICTLPNMVNQQRLPSDSALSKAKVVLFVGRLSYRDKRVDRLLRIWHRAQPSMPGWTLKIVGSGPEEAKLKALATKLQLQNLSFEGYHTDMQSYYSEAAILCMTSNFEGWPLVVAEAQTAGVVPVVFDSFGGAKDQIPHDHCGLRITPFSEEVYADALIALTQNPERLCQMSQGAQQQAATYTQDKTLHAWQSIL